MFKMSIAAQKVKETPIRMAAKVFHDERGQGVMEYFILIVGIGLVASYFVGNLANDGLGVKFNELTSKIANIKLPDIGLR
ncbi:MAG: hypothetical protein ACOY46_09805 [Bacillota bacterium]